MPRHGPADSGASLETMPRPQPSRSKTPQAPSAPEVVDPRWLVKALAVVLVIGLICSYLTLCLLFYQGQWQLVLHPLRTTIAPSAIGDTPIQLIHFAPDESAVPQLLGWWIPSSTPTSRYSGNTVLFLPDGDGSLASSIPTLTTLHSLGLDIFAFDYRGYGQSAATHPSQASMTHDAESALQYLTASRALPPSHLLLYGAGLGASLAVTLASQNPGLPALILDSPKGDLLPAVERDEHSRLIPLRLLFTQHFALAAPLATLRTPKLVLSFPGQPPLAAVPADPKISVLLPSRDTPLYPRALTRFLDQYVSTAAPPLKLQPAPAATQLP